MSVTLRQLSDGCGLVRSAVANILSSQFGAFSPKTRERVLATSRRHGYAPSRLPGFLRQRHTPAVAVLVPELTHQFYAKLLSALCNKLGKMKKAWGLLLTGGPHSGQLPIKANSLKGTG